jgi:hypothetical protein
MIKRLGVVAILIGIVAVVLRKVRRVLGGEDSEQAA